MFSQPIEEHEAFWFFGYSLFPTAFTFGLLILHYPSSSNSRLTKTSFHHSSDLNSLVSFRVNLKADIEPELKTRMSSPICRIFPTPRASLEGLNTLDFDNGLESRSKRVFSLSLNFEYETQEIKQAMRAVVYDQPFKVTVREVEKPKILHPDDIIVKGKSFNMGLMHHLSTFFLILVSSHDVLHLWKVSATFFLVSIWVFW